MPVERRYREDEVREIFELATTRPVQQAASPTPTQGLTLAEIQGIGLEVGVPAEQIARAAEVLDQKPVKPARKSLGMPIEVSHVVPLPRAPTEHEWEQLVTELRSTFNARGKISVHGGLKEWSNGNLRSAIEATDTGYQLRLRTIKGNARAANTVGAISILVSAGFLVMAIAAGDVYELSALTGLLGMSTLGANFIRLPTWARKRGEQMAHIASRVREIIK